MNIIIVYIFIYNLKSWEKIDDRFIAKADPTFDLLTQKNYKDDRRVHRMPFSVYVPTQSVVRWLAHWQQANTNTGQP
jgi:hypothetical protein